MRTPDGSPAELASTRDGTAFVATLPLRDVGAYDVVVVRDGEVVARRKVAYEGGAESSTEPDRSLLETLAGETGGFVAPKPEEWARPRGDAVPRDTRLSGMLLAAGIALVFAEWILRRWGGRRRRVPQETETSSLTALLRAKERSAPANVSGNVAPVLMTHVGSVESQLARLRQAKARAAR